jgi:8-oxo-dGTP diphosphatase
VIHVAAGVIVDADGRLLLAERPAGKHLAGLWEFPGGKLEPGESVATALARELAEELGIVVTASAPLVAVPWTYGEKSLLLDARWVTAWTGEPRSLEGQALRWARMDAVEPAILAPADRAILAACLLAKPRRSHP